MDDDKTKVATATPTKLRNGSWGARVQGNVREGDVVMVQTKGGKSWEARIERVLWTGDGVSVCATANTRCSVTQGTSRAPSSKQVRYAASLVERLKNDDYGTYTTFGFQGMENEDRVAKLTSREISDFIEQIRGELY